MSKFLLAAAFAIAIPSAAMAQVTTTPAPPPSAAMPSDTKDRPPIAGANSFTETQARERIEAQGFTGVSGLQKDDNSIWRGKAMKNGAQVDVALDFQGNVVAR